jgi:hypothetical protein
MKKILAVGCGAIGSLFAAHLAKGGEVEVYAFDVSQPHVDAINRSGLRLSGATDLHVKVAKADTDRHNFRSATTEWWRRRRFTRRGDQGSGTLLRLPQRGMLRAKRRGQRGDHR